MKIGIIGFGYWGQIITKTLQQMGYSEILVCDTMPIDWVKLGLGSKYKIVDLYEDMECDKVFVVTPTSAHYEICKYFLEKGVDVFCEKPLTLDIEQNELLYSIADKSGANLFVDWTFLFNEQVKTIKRFIEDSHDSMGVLKNVFMNRLNFGPIRYDVNARWDLASHDVSILLWLLNSNPTSCLWTDYNNLGGTQDDSVLGLLNFSGVNVVINASWSFPKKNRVCYFVFENSLITWDDVRKSINLDQLVSQEKGSNSPVSPLVSSVGAFLNNENYDYATQKYITLQTTKVLSDVYKI